MIKNKTKSYLNRLIQWYNNLDPDEKSEQEEFELFLKKYDERRNKIARMYKLPPENLNELSLSFENAYTQRKISEANKSLKIATWVLAAATIALVIGEVYGATKLENTLETFSYLILIIILIGLSYVVFEGILKFIIFVWKKMKNK
jgi:hypothetical protein